MDAASSWHMEQKERVTTYTPAKPDVPTDNRCAAGDDYCARNVPPPPPGSVEPFSGTVYSSDWIAVMIVSCAVFFFATRRA